MNRNKLILIIIWCINIVALFITILLPKNNNIYNISYYIFNIGIFLVPILLAIYEIAIIKRGENFNGIWIQGIGAIALIGLSMVRFISTILKEALPMLITIFLVCIILELLLIILSKKDLTINQHIWMLIGNVSITVLYFMLAMIVSYDFSNAW